MKRNTTEREKEILLYLNKLRESGDTNMFGAAPYIMEEFPGTEKSEARTLLSLWMGNYNKEGNYDEVEDKKQTA